MIGRELLHFLEFETVLLRKGLGCAVLESVDGEGSAILERVIVNDHVGG